LEEGEMKRGPYIAEMTRLGDPFRRDNWRFAPNGRLLNPPPRLRRREVRYEQSDSDCEWTLGTESDGSPDQVQTGDNDDAGPAPVGENCALGEVKNGDVAAGCSDEEVNDLDWLALEGDWADSVSDDSTFRFQGI
jgi:hypothetical protein